MEHEWKIAKPSAACSLCQTSFTAVSSDADRAAAVDSAPRTYFSALIQVNDVLVRTDFCAECFKDKRPADVYYFWKTAIPTGDAAVRRPAPVDIEFVLDFFKRLEGESAPQRVAFRYILALMLSRKKILLSDGKTRDPQGTEVQLFREKRGGQVHRVYAPELNPDEIGTVTDELGALLGLGKPATPAAVPANSDGATTNESASTAADAATAAAAPGSETEATRSAS